MHNKLAKATGRIRRFSQLKGDRFNSLRRHCEMLADQVWALTRWKLQPSPSPPDFDGDVRYALITVNFSTTHYLKLILAGNGAILRPFADS